MGLVEIILFEMLKGKTEHVAFWLLDKILAVQLNLNPIMNLSVNQFLIRILLSKEYQGLFSWG